VPRKKATDNGGGYKGERPITQEGDQAARAHQSPPEIHQGENDQERTAEKPENVEAIPVIEPVGNTVDGMEDASESRPAATRGRKPPTPDPKNLFKPGQSGNPGGRRAIDPLVKKLLADATPDAVRTIIDMASNPKTPPRERLAAAMGIMERMYGKAVQPIDADISGDVRAIVVQFVGDLAAQAK
jgi:hypothetical protein